MFSIRAIWIPRILLIGFLTPFTAWSADLSTTPGPPTASHPHQGAGLKDTLGLKTKAANDEDFLPPDEAYRFSGELSRPGVLHLRWVIADGYYLYKHRMKVTSGSTQVQLGAFKLPHGDTKTDEYFGTQEVYHHQVEADVPFSRATSATREIEAHVTYQGCAEAGLCYPPITKILKLKLPLS
jgi:thiol:disulfide interchange protein DsbD